MQIRWSYDRLISTLGFPILVRWHLYILNRAPECCPLWYNVSLYTELQRQNKAKLLIHKRYQNKQPSNGVFIMGILATIFGEPTENTCNGFYFGVLKITSCARNCTLASICYNLNVVDMRVDMCTTRPITSLKHFLSQFKFNEKFVSL